jgi:flap endonuclease-1
MTIKGLNPWLKEHAPHALSQITITELSGTRVAIDAYNWIYQQYFQAKKRIIENTNVAVEDPNPEAIFCEWMRLLCEFVKTWVTHSITPVFVFDGEAPMEKGETQKKRQERRQHDYDRLMAKKDFIRKGDSLSYTETDIEELRKYMRNYRDLPKSHLERFREVLREMGLPVVDAKWEGEQLCSMLAREGKVSAVYSTDTDNIAYGAPLLLNGFVESFYTAEGWPIPRFSCVWYDNILLELGYSRQQFVDLCIMAGCDYNRNMPRIAIKTAYKHLNRWASLDNFPPEEYALSCLEYERCRQLFSPVSSGDIWAAGDLDVHKRLPAEYEAIFNRFHIGYTSYGLVEKLLALPPPKEKYLVPPPTPKTIFTSDLTLKVRPPSSPPLS